MSTLNFFIGDVLSRASNPATGDVYDIHSVRILQGDSSDGTFTTIDTVKVSPQTQFITSTAGQVNYLDKWYKLQFISDPAITPIVELEPTESTVVEEIWSLVDDIRAWLGDTNMQEPAWTDEEYIQNIRFAIRQYKGRDGIYHIRESDVLPIQLLVRIEFCYIIAYEHAKYYKLEAPSASLDKSQIMEHYLRVAKQAEDHYDKIVARFRNGLNEQGQANGAQIEVGNVIVASKHTKKPEPYSYSNRSAVYPFPED